MTVSFRLRTILVQLLSVVFMVKNVDGQINDDKDWYHGWTVGMGVTYQVMDFSEDLATLVVGGSMAVNEKAALLIYSTDNALSQKEPIDYVFIDEWLVDTKGLTKFIGVRAVAMQFNLAWRVMAVMETDKDRTAMTLVSFSHDQGVNLVYIDDFFSDTDQKFNSPIIRFRNKDQIWLQAQLMTKVDNKQQRSIFSIQLDVSSGPINIWNSSELVTVDQNQKLKSFALTETHMFRVTEGTCRKNSGADIFKGGILVTTVSSPNNNSEIATLRAFCIDPTVFNKTFKPADQVDGESFSYDILAIDTGETIIFQQETNSNSAGFLTIATDSLDNSNITFLLKRFQFTNEQSVDSFSITKRNELLGINSIDMAIRSDTGSILLLLGVNLFDPNASQFTEYNVDMKTQGVGIDLHFDSLYLDLQIGNNKQNFAIMGEDFLLKFDINPAVEQTSQCLTAILIEEATPLIENSLTEIFDFHEQLVSDTDVHEVQQSPYAGFAYKERITDSSYKPVLQPESQINNLCSGLQLDDFSLDIGCSITLPEISADTYTYRIGKPVLKLVFSGYHSSPCQVVRSVINEDDTSLIDSSPFIVFVQGGPEGASDRLLVTTSKPSEVGTYSLKYVMKSMDDPLLLREELSFQINIIEAEEASCTKEWRYPQESQPFDSVYRMGDDEAQAIVFEGVDVTNCPFELTVLNITNSYSPQQIDTAVAALIQPVLLAEFNTESQVNMISPGSLLIQPHAEWTLGKHHLSLVITTNLGDDLEQSGESQSLDFYVSVVPCISVPEGTKDVSNSDIVYVIGDPQLKLPIVHAVSPGCSNSEFSLVSDQDDKQLPAAFNVDIDSELRQVSISIRADEVEQLGPGTVTLEVWETDLFNKQIAKTLFDINVINRTIEQLNITVETLPDIKIEDTVEFPSFRLKSFSMMGELEIEFTQSLNVPKNITMINDEVFELQLITDESNLIENSSNKNFAWTVTQFEENKMIVQVTFKHPEYISAGKNRDILIAKVINQKYFTAKEARCCIPKGVTDTTLVPKIMDDTSLTQTFALFTGSIGNASNGTFLGNIVINLFVSTSMNLLWGVFHTMQIIGHFPLLNTMMPSNAHWLFSAILKVATFDVLPVEEIVEEFEESVGLERDSFELSDTMSENGYDSSDPIRNLQLMFICIVFLLVAYPFLVLSLRALFFWSPRCKCFLIAMNRPIFWNVYIRFTYEAILELSITCLLRFKVLNFDSASDYFHSIFALTLAIFLALFWISTNIFLQVNASKQSTLRSIETVKNQRYSNDEIWLGLRSPTPRAILILYPNFFLLRRVLFAVAIVHLNDRPYFQIQLLVTKTLASLLLTAHLKPYTTKQENWQEVSNESMTLICAYVLFTFTKFVPDAGCRHIMGWLMCVLVTLVILTNLGILTLQGLKRGYRWLKLRYIRRKNRQLGQKQGKKKKQLDYVEAGDGYKSSTGFGPIYTQMIVKEAPSPPRLLITQELDDEQNLRQMQAQTSAKRQESNEQWMQPQLQQIFPQPLILTDGLESIKSEEVEILLQNTPKFFTESRQVIEDQELYARHSFTTPKKIEEEKKIIVSPRRNQILPTNFEPEHVAETERELLGIKKYLTQKEITFDEVALVSIQEKIKSKRRTTMKKSFKKTVKLTKRMLAFQEKSETKKKEDQWK